MMMSLNSKQAFAMAHTSLPEPKYSLHSSSSSTLTSNAPSSSCSSSRHSSTIISSSGSSSSSSEAMRRACLPTPPVRILHNHCLKAHFDSPLFFFLFFFCLMFFSCLHSKSPNTSIFFFSPLLNLCIQSALPSVLIFMTWDAACVLFCVLPFLGFLFFTFWKCFKTRSGGRIPC